MTFILPFPLNKITQVMLRGSVREVSPESAEGRRFGDLSAFGVDTVGGCGIYQRHGGGEGLGEGHRHDDSESCQGRPALGKGLYYKDSLYPPGSFQVAFPHAAEKMQKIILQLKEGKIDHLLPPGTDN